MTEVIRTVSPVSLMKRERAMASGQPGIRPSSPSSSRTSSMRGVGRRQDQVGLVEACRRRCAVPAARTPSSSAARAAANAASSPASTAASTAASSSLSAVDRVVGDVELTLAEDPDDHAWPLLGCSALDRLLAARRSRMSPPSTGARWPAGRAGALEPGELGLDVGLRAHRLELAGDVVAAR